MTEVEYLEFITQGRFDELANLIRFSPDITEEERQELLYDLEIVKQEAEYDKGREEQRIADKYSNLETTKTKSDTSSIQIKILDINNRQIGVAIDGNEKTLLDLYAKTVYDSLKKPILSEKLNFAAVMKKFKLISDGFRFNGLINGRKIQVFPIGNNNEIRAYAITVSSNSDGQEIRLVIDFAADLDLYLTGLQETFPTVA